MAAAQWMLIPIPPWLTMPKGELPGWLATVMVYFIIVYFLSLFLMITMCVRDDYRTRKKR